MKTRYFITVALSLVCLAGILHAGELPLGDPANTPNDSEKSDSLNFQFGTPPAIQWYDMFKNIPTDWVRYSSITFTKENIPAMIAMTAATAVLIATDDPTYRISRELYEEHNAVRRAADIGEYIGDGKTHFGLAAGFAAYGFLESDQRALRTASQITETVLACGVVVQVLKHLTGRESPIVATKPGGAWNFFPNQIEYHRRVPAFDAYPSGHVATALATFTVIAENYPEITWIRPVSYSLVGILALSMAGTGIHWYSDYPLGIALGYSFGMLAAHPETFQIKQPAEENPVGISVTPKIGYFGNGVQLTLTF